MLTIVFLAITLRCHPTINTICRMAIWQNQSIQLVNETNSMYQQIDSDVLEGGIRLLIQLSKTVGRGCSGSVCSLPIRLISYQPNPHPYVQETLALQFLYLRYRIKQRTLSARPEFPQT